MPEATSPNPANYRPDKADQAIAGLRDPRKVRAWAAAQFTGTFANTNTGLGQIQIGNGSGLDVFAQASTQPNPGQHPYNNWLGSDAKPLFEFFPEAVGVYIGGFGDSAAVDIGKIIAETCILTIQKEGQGAILRQPLLTVPAGVGLESRGWDSSGLGPFFRTRNGQLGTQGLFPIPRNVVFDKVTSLNAYINTTVQGAAAIAALAGSFPTEGGIIAVELYGVAELNIGAQR